MDLRDENFISLASFEIISFDFFFLIDAKKIILFVESHVELRITKHRFEIVYIENSYDLISIIHRVLN